MNSKPNLFGTERPKHFILDLRSDRVNQENLNFDIVCEKYGETYGYWEEDCYAFETMLKNNPVFKDMLKALVASEKLKNDNTSVTKQIESAQADEPTIDDNEFYFYPIILIPMPCRNLNSIDVLYYEIRIPYAETKILVHSDYNVQSTLDLLMWLKSFVLTSKKSA